MYKVLNLDEKSKCSKVENDDEDFPMLDQNMEFKKGLHAHTARAVLII